MSTNSLFLPHKVMCHIALAKCYVPTLSEARSGVDWVDLMAAQGAFGTVFYDRSILRLKHRGYYRSGRLVIKIGPKCALGSHEIRQIHSTPSLGQSIMIIRFELVQRPHSSQAGLPKSVCHQVPIFQQSRYHV